MDNWSWISRKSIGQFSSIEEKMILELMPSASGDDGDPRYFEFSDATLQVLNSNYKPSVLINFKDAFPVSLSTLDFDVTTRDYNYFHSRSNFQIYHL